MDNFLSSRLATENTRLAFLGLGNISRMFTLPWSIVLVILSPIDRSVWAGVTTVLICSLVYPVSIRRVLRFRVLLFIGLITVPFIFFEETSRYLFSIPISDDGLKLSIQAASRAITIMIAVNGFINIVDISKMAGFLERFGLNGLGFSMGVALNMVPALRRSSVNTWNTVKMRGGLKTHRLRTLRMIFITIITNALQYAENVTLAAECRAFDPQKKTHEPIQLNWTDGIFVSFQILLLVVIVAI